MCLDCATRPHLTNGRDTVSRRSLLGGAGAAGALALMGTPAVSAAAAPSQRRPRGSGLSVVTLGTKGGPPPSAARAGICTAVVVDGAVYLVDAGRAAATQYVNAGLAYADLAGVFITHLHADHVADYFNLFLLGGFVSPQQSDSVPGPVPVIGPGPAGGLPPTFGGGTSPTVNPDDPTPGLATVTDHWNHAFAYSTNVFMRDSHTRNLRELADVRETQVPDVGASFENTAPAMEPFVVYEDERVRVSTVLVPHGPVFPAFAYRFDTDHGSVTCSGDTTYSDNLLTLAHRSDLLVHEAINVQGWGGPAAVKDHLLEGHVEIQHVGGVAEQADVGHLVLSHVGDMATDPLPEAKWRKWARQGYGGKVDVAADLDTFPVRRR